MSIQFVFGGAGAGKTEYMLRQMLREAPRDFQKQWILVVPEQDTLAMQRRILAHPENRGHGILNIDVMSFQRMAYRVFEEKGITLPRIIDDLGKIMILREVLGKLSPQLSLYKSQLNKPGFLDELKSQISEFYQYRILPEMLRLVAERSDSPYVKSKLQDLAMIYEAFLSYMESHGFMAEEELLDRLYEALPDSHIFDGAALLFDGFTGFTPVQLRVLEELLPKADALQFALCLREDEREQVYEKCGPEALFYLTCQTVQKLSAMAAQLQVPVLPEIDLNRYDAITGVPRDTKAPLPRFQQAPALGVIEQKLYRSALSDNVFDSAAPVSDVEIWEAPDQKSEIEAIAAEIEKAVREEGLCYQDIGILLTAPSDYRDLIFKTFSEAGIPYFFDDAGSLLDSPFAEVMRAALEAVDQSFGFDPVLRFLRALPKDTAAEENEIDLFDNYLREKGLRGVSAYQKTWEQYEALRLKWMTPLLTMYEATKTRNTPVAARVEALRQLLGELRAEEKVSAMASRLEKEGEQNRAEALRQSITVLYEVLDRLAELLGTLPISRGEFREVLDAGIQEASVRMIPATIDQVVVGDMTRSRFLSPKRFFLAGANASLLPKADAGKKLLGDRERHLFREADIELAPDRMEDALVGRFYIYRALLNPSERLVLSYPLKGRAGKALKPAGLLNELRTILPGLPARQLENTRREIYTEKELLRELSRAMPLLLEQFSAGETGTQKEEQKEAQEMDLLRLLYETPEGREKARQLLAAAFTCYTESRLTLEAAKALYGELISGSVTRLELFNGCAFAHFLKYGLGLTERKSYEVQAFDLGTLYHAAIEKAFRLAASEKRELWEYDEAELRTLCGQAVEQAAAECGEKLLNDSARNRYLIRKLRDITETTLLTLAEQLRRGDFRTRELEKSFDLVRAGLRLKGRIDRVDLCEDAERVYVRVIDYKSGKTAFDLNKVYEGLQLQLATYLNVMLTNLRNRYPEKEIVPSGMLYYHIDDPILPYVPGEDAEELSRDRLRALRMDGLINTDRESVRHMDREAVKESDILPLTLKDGEADPRKKSAASTAMFRALERFVNARLQQDGERIRGGEIGIHPIQENKQRSNCSFCPYHAVCCFDPRIAGFRYRKLGNLSAEEIWGELTREDMPETAEKSGQAAASDSEREEPIEK